MARLNDKLDSGDESPELSTLLLKPGEAGTGSPTKTPKKAVGSGRSPRKESMRDSARHSDDAKSISNAKSYEKRRGKQRPLGSSKLASVNSLLPPKFNHGFNARGHDDTATDCSAKDQRLRSSPRKLAKVPMDHAKFASRLSDASLSFSDGDGSFTDLSGFIVPDSASDDEALPHRLYRRRNAKEYSNGPKVPEAKTLLSPKVSPSKRRKDYDVVDLTSPQRRVSTFLSPNSQPGCRTPPKKTDSIEGVSELDEPFSKLRL